MNPATERQFKGSRVDALSVIIGAVMIIVYVGYYYGTGAHTDYLPWIKHLADPTSFTRDWVIISPAYHENMLRLLAAASRLISLPLAVFITHAVSAVLFVGAVLLLSRALFPARLVFYVAIFLLLHWGLDIYGAEAVGGNTLFSYQFAPHVVAVPFCLLAFYCFIQERYTVAGLFAGVATNIHFLLGCITMLIIGAYLLLHVMRLGWQRVALGFLAYGVVAAYTLAPVLRNQLTMPTASAVPHPFTTIMAQFRTPHHYLPTTWPWASYARFLTFLLIAVAGFHYKPPPGPHRRILFVGGAIILLCLIGTIFVEYIPIDLVTKLQFFRMTIFLKLFVILYVANYLLKILEKGDRLEVLLTLALLLANHYIGVGLLAAALVGRHYGKSSVLRGALWGGGLLLFSLWNLFITHRTSGTLNLNATAYWRPALIALPGMLILYGLYQFWQRRAARMTSVLLIAMIGILAKDTALAWHDKGLAYYFRYEMKAITPWDQMGVWVRDHTPKNALFITPPYIGGFRVYAERAIIADFATGPLWDQDLPEWKRRLEELCGGAPLNCNFNTCAEVMPRGYNGLDEAAIRALAQKYDADYFVTERREDLPFEMVYANEEFAVFKLR